MKCFVCKKDFPSTQLCLRHINWYHGNENIFECHICNTIRLFTSLNSFQKHINRHIENEDLVSHDFSNFFENESHDSVSPLDNEQFLRTHTPLTSTHNNIPINNPSFISLNDFKDTMEREIFIIMQNIYQNPGDCRKSIQDFIIIMNKFLNGQMLKDAEKLILQEISKTAENTSYKIQLQEFVSNIFFLIRDSISSISTEHRRIKFLKTRANFILPQSITVGQRLETHKIGIRRFVKSIPIKITCVPLAETLKSFLRDKSTLDVIVNYLKFLDEESKTGVISNIIQTEFWKDKLLVYDKNDLVLPLVLFFDEFENNNPLGSRPGLQSLGGVYFSCPAFPPSHRSKLEYLILSTLINSLDLKLMGYKRCFSPLLQELEKLETDGIEINGSKLYFVLAICIGDNKGLNAFLGFSQSFVSNFFCRLCKMPKEDTRFCVTADGIEHLLRNIGNYDEDITRNNVSETGVKEICSFNVLTNFHCVENPSVDIMHDQLEGNLNWDIALLLRQFIDNDKFFTLNQLNQRISMFDFGLYEHINKPQDITTDHLKNKKLKYSSSEIIWFIRYLPLLIEEWIPDDNEYYKFLIIVKQLWDILFLPKVTHQTSQILNIIIQQHHEMYLKLFKIPLRPKQHFMIHYPSIMNTVGPLIHLWAMRGEAKHRTLKSISKSTSSRKDIGYSIAYRYLLCNNNLCSKKKFQSEIKLGKLFFPDVYIVSTIGLDNEFTSFYTWIRINEIKLNVGQVLQIGFDNDYPSFGQIEAVFCSNSQYLLLMNAFETKYFCIKSQYHVVENVKKYCSWNLNTNIFDTDINTYALHKLRNNLVVV